MASESISNLSIGTPEKLLIKDVESQGTKHMKKMRKRHRMHIKYFPIFIVGISVVQVTLMYAMDHKLLAMIFGIDPRRRHEIWRFFTVMLVHTGAPHLWMTIILQLILGVLLEMVHSSRRTAIVYFSSIFGGSLFITVLRPHIYAVGASAGMYGLLFSHLSTLILNWNDTDKRFCRFFWLLCYICFDVSLSLYLEIVAEAYLNTSNPGHIEGGMIGLLVSILVLKSVQRDSWEHKLKKAILLIIAATCVTILLINIIATDLYLPTEWNFDYQRTYQGNSTTRQYDFRGTIFGVLVYPQGV